MSEPTWADAFAWLRRYAPSAGAIEVYDDPAIYRGEPTRVVRLYGATEEDRARVQQGLNLRAPWTRWEVLAPADGDSTDRSPRDSTVA